jgi:hypothetical protein
MHLPRAKLLFLSLLLVGSVALAEEETPPSEGLLAAPIKTLKEMPTLIPEVILNRDDLHIWYRYVQNFRQAHHFALSGGAGTESWDVTRLGRVENQTVQGDVYHGLLTYSYYLPIYRKLGYFLGTTLGYSTRELNEGKTFIAPWAVSYPGIAGGLAYAPTPGFRVNGGIGAVLRRWDGLSSKVSDRRATSIGITSQSIDLNLSMDVFVTLTSALRLEVHQTHDYFPVPRGALGGIDARLYREDRWFGAGLLYHLL